MVTKKSIESEIESLTNMKGIAESFEEIAALRIRRNRDQVLKNRQFTTEVNEIFQQVKIASVNIIDPKQKSFLKKNGRTLFVYLSANTGLYGDIVRRTFNLFAKYVGQWADNVLIIGKVGLKLASERKIIKPVAYFDLPDDTIDTQSIKKISSYLLDFERVIVFYAKFEGILHQEETMIDLSGNPSLPSFTPPQAPQFKIKYFFEPEVTKILAFFETEIFESLLEQTVREFQLAKLSSRVVGLNSAIDHIENELKKTTSKRNEFLHQESNRKQLQTFSSMSLWDI